MTALDRALSAPKSLTSDELAEMLASSDEGLWREIFAAAREVKARCGKTEILPRGLIETSNICAKDCLYCGIRKGNAKVPRYLIPEEVVAQCIEEARRRGYPAVAFQAGEIESEANTAYYERLTAYAVGRAGSMTPPLEVTLSLGEQTEEVYRRWKDAGAMRYLIRIETSNRELYAKIHPAECSFDRRLGCIRTLKKLGYVTGSGVMIGIPGQTIADLARDIVFYGDENLDMVGMGPYVPNGDMPLRTAVVGSRSRTKDDNVHRTTWASDYTYKMIALTRLYLHDVNIVAATALEALDPEGGRNRGIEAGANVVMPVLTPEKYRGCYDLYPGKTVVVGSPSRTEDANLHCTTATNNYDFSRD